MTLEQGAFVLIDYAVYSKDDQKLIDTTIADKAKEGNIYNENIKYEPELVIIGEGLIFKSLEEKIVNLSEGDSATIELPPEKAFGKRDPSKIRTVSARELTRRGIVPKVNEEVEINGQRAVVKSVGGGRVILDFNHPLAGKTLVYELKIVKVVKEPAEKVKELIYRWLKKVINRNEIRVRITKKTVTITLPHKSLLVENVAVVRRGIVRDIQKYFPEIEKIVFKEEYELSSKKKKTIQPAEQQQVKVSGQEDIQKTQ